MKPVQEKLRETAKREMSMCEECRRGKSGRTAEIHVVINRETRKKAQ
jgi:hypothetical protein